MTVTASDRITLVEVPLDKIRVNPFQPRREFDEEELRDLAASIRELGLLQPPLVRRLPGDSGYELIAGERRFRASALAGRKTIPVVVSAHGDAESAEAALVENIQRVDLNPIEVAQALAALMDEHLYRQEELAQRVGKKRSTVANYLRLLTLPSEIQDSVAGGALTMGHAKVILSVVGTSKRRELHQRIIQESLTVREAERVALRWQKKVSPQAVLPLGQDEHLRCLQDSLQNRLGTRVSIKGGGKEGSINIHYYSLDDLDRILQVIGAEI